MIMIMMLVFLPWKAIFFFLVLSIFESKVRSSIFPFHLFLSFWLIENLNVRLLIIRQELLRGKREVTAYLLSLAAMLKEIWEQVNEFSYGTFSVSSPFQRASLVPPCVWYYFQLIKTSLEKTASQRKKETMILKLYLTFVYLFASTSHFIEES